MPILNNGVKGESQLSENWIKAVADKLPEELKNDLLKAIDKKHID